MLSKDLIFTVTSLVPLMSMALSTSLCLEIIYINPGYLVCVANTRHRGCDVVHRPFLVICVDNAGGSDVVYPYLC